MSQVTVVNESSYSGDNSLSQTILTFECYRSIIYFPRIEKRRLTFEKQFWNLVVLGNPAFYYLFNNSHDSPLELIQRS